MRQSHGFEVEINHSLTVETRLLLARASESLLWSDGRDEPQRGSKIGFVKLPSTLQLGEICNKVQRDSCNKEHEGGLEIAPRKRPGLRLRSGMW